MKQAVVLYKMECEKYDTRLVVKCNFEFKNLEDL